MAFSHPIRSNPNKSNTNPLDEHFTCTSRTSSFEESQTHSMICIASHSAYPVPPFPFMVVFRLQRRRGLVWHVIKKFRTKVHVQCTVDHVDGGQKKRGHSQGGCRHPGSRRPRPTFPVQARPRLGHNFTLIGQNVGFTLLDWGHGKFNHGVHVNATSFCCEEHLYKGHSWLL